jgi:ABC-type glycerol-3-phosphate transport system substrate-binding protein
MPIGISDYTTYVTLSIGAPELKGWWKMAPLPGMPQADGSIDRSAGGIGNASAIFTQSRKRVAAWELLKWWTSTEIQARFGEELEALIGIEARWNTANIEALRSLPWPSEDITAILEQWEWFREQPIVLGGYFTSRHVQFAWTRVVLQGENPREALELATEDINRELRRKQAEFGFRPPAAVAREIPAEIERLIEERMR